ncbi:MAG: M28 family metallopeptidase [Prolixibacteraceae bacterium]
MGTIKLWISLFTFLSTPAVIQAQTYTVPIDSVICRITTSSYRSHFDSIRTQAHSNRKVQETAQQSNDHDACRDYIFRSFQTYLGQDNCYLNHFESGDHGGLANVIGVKKGSNQNKGIWIISAHYDSNNNNQTNKEQQIISPGANDNGTGIATILEIARIIGRLETEASILFAAWDLEEVFTDGFGTGSNEWLMQFVKRRKPTDWSNLGNHGWVNKNDIRGNINFDMFGNPQLSDQELPVLWACYAMENQQYFTEDYAATINKYIPEIRAISYGKLIWSDHYTFASRNIPAVENLESNYQEDPFYHTYADHLNNPDNINFDFATKVCKGGLAYLLEQVVQIQFNSAEHKKANFCMAETPNYYELYTTVGLGNIQIYNQYGTLIWEDIGQSNYKFSPPTNDWYYIRTNYLNTAYRQFIHLNKKEGFF